MPRLTFAGWTVPRPCASSMAYIISRAAEAALHGDMAGSFRLRVGDYRVLFSLHEGVMRIFGVRRRDKAYRH